MPTDLSRRSACEQHVTTSTIANRHLLLLSPKADVFDASIDTLDGADGRENVKIYVHLLSSEIFN